MTYIDFFKACALTSAAAPKLDMIEAGHQTGDEDEKIGINALQIRTARNRRCVSYLSYTNEGVSDNQEYFSNAVLDFFLDGDPYYSLIDKDWTYFWKVYAFEPDAGKSYLLASSIGDSDWTNQSLILTKNPDSNELMSLGDLVTITRDSDTVTENLLGQWARSLDIADAKDGTFTVTWLISAMCTGNIGVSITYNIDSTGISIKDTPIPLSEIKEWTSWRDFDVQISPEDSTTAFHVSPDEKVTLT